MHKNTFFICIVTAGVLVISSGGAIAYPSQGDAQFPVAKVPNWGAMRTVSEWSRDYNEMTDEDFIAVPQYDLSRLKKPLWKILTSFTQENQNILTEKLTYSTRHFGAYDLDADEFTANHPGIDVKLPFGTPISSVASGIVHQISEDDRLGLYIIIEHRRESETFFSVYGHLSEAFVKEGAVVSIEDFIAIVGMTGSTNNPHLHLQIDRGRGFAIHEPYFPASMPSKEVADRFTVHPISFIQEL